MKKSAYRIKLFFIISLLMFVLMPLSGCKKDKLGYCQCSCGSGYMCYKLTTEEECDEIDKEQGCDCEWDED